jgi:DNA polymerase III delta subunit
MQNLHLIIGEDDFLVTQTAKKILGDAEGLEIIDSNLSTNAELQLRDIALADESFSTPPFLDPSKSTWWKNIKFLPQASGKSCAEDVKAALEKLAAKFAASPMPDNQKFVITATKMLATSVFAKTMKTAGEVIVFSSGKPWERAKEAVVRAIDLASTEGLKFEPGAAEVFVSRVGPDTRSIMNEIAKMRDYLGNDKDPISISDIAEITSQGAGVEPEIWSITDALGARDVAKLVSALTQFERENGFAVMVVTVAEKFIRSLLELKDASATNRLDDATSGMAPFAVKKNMGFVSKWSLMELRSARARLVALRERVVSSSGSADVLVMTELVRICRARTGGRK